jgi:hypothetical protein
MVCFQTKNPNLGKFWGVLQWKILVYFMTIWSILRPLEIFSSHLVYFVVIWYIFPRFGILYQGKSGNHDAHHATPLGPCKTFHADGTEANFQKNNFIYLLQNWFC